MMAGSYASTRYPDMDDPFTWIGQIAGRGARIASGAPLEYVGDTTPPPAVTGLVVTGTLVRSILGRDVVRLTLVWDPVVYDTSDSEITTPSDIAPVEGYLVSYQITGGSWTTEAFTATAGVTIDDLDAVAVNIAVRVRTQSVTGAKGAFATANITVTKDLLAPPVPSAPLVEQRTKGVDIRWDGTFVAGAAQPTDFSHVLVEYHYGDGGWLRGGELGSGGVMAIQTTGLSAVTARLSAFDINKNQSGYSGTNTATAQPVFNADIYDDAINAAKIADNAVNTLNIVQDAITNVQIALNAVGTDEIAADAVKANEIFAGSINTLKLATGAVIADKIDALAVVAGKINAGAVISTTIDTGAVNAGKVETRSLGAYQITGNSITANEIKVGEVKADNIHADALTAKTLRTSTANQRVQLTSGTDRLSWYNSSGTETSYMAGNSWSTGSLIISSYATIYIDSQTSNVTVDCNLDCNGTVDCYTLQSSGEVWGSNARFASGYGEFGTLYQGGYQVYSLGNPPPAPATVPSYDSGGRRLLGNGNGGGVWWGGSTNYLHTDAGVQVQCLNIADSAWVSHAASTHPDMSSRVLKREIKELKAAKVKGKSGKDLVKSMKPVRYFWTEENPDQTEQIGFIAEEMLEVVPQAVIHVENKDQYGIHYGHLTAVLVQALQEMQEEIDDLRTKIPNKVA